jgi:hypothetical protein
MFSLLPPQGKQVLSAYSGHRILIPNNFVLRENTLDFFSSLYYIAMYVW